MDRLAASSKTLLRETYKDSNVAVADSHIEGCLSNSDIVAPDIPVELQWVNSHPLSIHGNLRGRYILLDFFTYCCINCMHILPALHQLEQETQDDGLVVVGVHSGKFTNEKTGRNILDAVNRYKITHPVVNDANYDLWNAYQIVCWPTLVLINPMGKIVLVSVGESDVLKVVRFVKDVLRVSPPTATDTMTPLMSFTSNTANQHEEGEAVPEKMLSYPGKVFYHPETNSVFISDTANDRIVQVNYLGEIVSKFPSPNTSHVTPPPGHVTSLSSPQGLLVYQDSLMVCDTSHHRLVRVPLHGGVMKGESGEVIAGTGSQGHDTEGGQTGVKQEISSPWALEVVFLDNVPGCHGDLLVVAMAGTHQIWGYSLTDVTITHRGVTTTHERGKTWRLAGNGEEANRNNSYPHKASFAQPSGVSYDGDKTLYIADSESSTVRSVELPSFVVKNVAGGGFDPTDLFSYGDQDGKGTSAKLQHPIGITCTQPNTLLVADSYNHKLKLVNTKTRVVSTVQNVMMDLSEPSGLTYDSSTGEIYTCDTNNHSVKVVHMGTPDTSSCGGDDVERSEKGVRELGIMERGSRVAMITTSSWIKEQNSASVLHLNLVFHSKLNTSASSNIKILSHDIGVMSRDVVEIPVTDKTVEISLDGGERALNLLITLFTCSNDGKCFMNRYLHRINFVEEHPGLKIQDEVVHINLE